MTDGLPISLARWGSMALRTRCTLRSVLVRSCRIQKNWLQEVLHQQILPFRLGIVPVPGNQGFQGLFDMIGIGIS